MDETEAKVVEQEDWESSNEALVELSPAAKRRVLARSVLLLACISVIASTPFAAHPFLPAVVAGRWFWRHSDSASAWEALWTPAHPASFYVLRFVIPIVIGTAALFVWPLVYEELFNSARALLRQQREWVARTIWDRISSLWLRIDWRRFLRIVGAVFVTLLASAVTWFGWSVWQSSTATDMALAPTATASGMRNSEAAVIAVAQDAPTALPEESASPPLEGWARIRVGMTSQEVLSVLGSPRDIDYYPGRQTWTYREDSSGYGGDYIWFEESSEGLHPVLRVTNFAED